MDYGLIKKRVLRATDHVLEILRKQIHVQMFL